MAGHVLDASESPLIPDLSLGVPRGAVAPPGWLSILRRADSVRWTARCTVGRVRGDMVTFLAMLTLVATLGAAALIVALGAGEPMRMLPTDAFGDAGEFALDVGSIDHTRLGPSGLPWRAR